MSSTAVAGSEAHYLPFGGYRGTAPTQTLTDRGYTGQKENLDLGLMYYNARYYLPSLGKFASADTLVPDPTNPQAFNRYSYVLNNPIRNSDPTGHRPTDGCTIEGCNIPAELEVNNAYAIIHNGEKHYFGSFDLMKGVLDFLSRLQIEGILDNPVITSSLRNPADAHKYSVAYNIIEDTLSKELLLNPSCYLNKQVMLKERTNKTTFNSKPSAVTA